MSIFLIYFEKNNPDAQWVSFRQKHPSIIETFTGVVSHENRVWNVEPVIVSVNEKITDAFVIHDGISSDQIFIQNFKNATILTQRKDLLEFFKKRLSIPSLNCFFIFHLYHGAVVGHIENITSREIRSLTLGEIGDFAGVIEPELLYHLANAKI